MDHIVNRSFTARLALLTTGLLVGTLAPAMAQDDPNGLVSQIRDERIQESSGLALSVKHADLAYTMNDEGGKNAKVYAIKVSTGAVVGTADISDLPIEDPESIAVDAAGTVWLGDLGDNDHQRDDTAIYAFPEPGPGAKTISSADRYGVTLPDGPQDVEGLMVQPHTDRVYVVSKNPDGTGRIFELPDLTPGLTAQGRDVGEAPEGVTDATFTNSGQWALLRTEDDLWIFNPKTWEAVGRVETPELEKGESVTVEQGDRTVLLGSEGKDSPIIRIALPEANASMPIQLDVTEDEGSSGASTLKLAISIVLLGGGMLVVGIIARRRMKI